MTSTPIPAGVLTVDDEPRTMGRRPFWAVQFEADGPVKFWADADERARLLSSPRPDGATDDEVDTWLTDAMSVIHQHCNSDGSDDDHNDWVTDLANELERVVGPARYPRPPRHDGVPDHAVAEAVRLLEAATPGPWSWSKRSDRLSGGTNGYDDVMTAREYRDGPEVEVSDEDAELIAAAPTIIANLLALLGVPVPPYQPTPPEPEPAETLAECMKAITEAERRAWNQSACGPIAAPVSEVRTGPHNRGEGLTRLIAKVQLGLGNLSDYERATVVEAREFVARWDAEDAAPAETLADIAGDMREDLARDIAWGQVRVGRYADRIEAAAGLSVPSEGGES